MSTPNPVFQAAAPALISIIKDLQQFMTDMGTDPAKWVLNFPGAQLKLTGAITLAFPELVSAEAGALQVDINNKMNGWITKLQALQTAK